MPTPSSATRPFVLAIDFGGTKMALGTADSKGRILESARLDTEAGRGAGQGVERALQAAQELLARTDGQCVGLAAVTPGVVRPDRVLLAPNVPGWGDLSLAAVLQDGLGVARVKVENDVRAAALPRLAGAASREPIRQCF